MTRTLSLLLTIFITSMTGILSGCKNEEQVPPTMTETGVTEENGPSAILPEFLPPNKIREEYYQLDFNETPLFYKLRVVRNNYVKGQNLFEDIQIQNDRILNFLTSPNSDEAKARTAMLEETIALWKYTFESQIQPGFGESEAWLRLYEKDSGEIKSHYKDSVADTTDTLAWFKSRIDKRIYRGYPKEGNSYEQFILTGFLLAYLDRSSPDVIVDALVPPEECAVIPMSQIVKRLSTYFSLRLGKPIARAILTDRYFYPDAKDVWGVKDGSGFLKQPVETEVTEIDFDRPRGEVIASLERLIKEIEETKSSDQKGRRLSSIGKLFFDRALLFAAEESNPKR